MAVLKTYGGAKDFRHLHRLELLGAEDGGDGVLVLAVARAGEQLLPPTLA